MKQKISFQNNKMHFTIKSISVNFLIIIGIFFQFTCLYGQTKMNSTGNQGNSIDSVKGITIHQEIYIKASPQRIYEILLSSKEFSACTKKSFNDFSAASATVDGAVGGTFSLFDGH